jgi:hypothetical protein
MTKSYYLNRASTTFMSADLPEIKLQRARAPSNQRADAFTVKACIDSLQRELVKVAALAASYEA